MRKGYTLLEILVSLAIISSSIIAFFQIFSLGFGTFSKLDLYQDLYIAMTNLVEEINLINDFEENKGKVGKIGNFDYEWQASPATPKRVMMTADEFPGDYSAALYKIVVRIHFETQGKKKDYREFTFFKVGWTRAER